MSSDPFREAYEYAFLRMENVQFDAALGRWTVHADPTIAILWLVAVLICCLPRFIPGLVPVWGTGAVALFVLTAVLTLLYNAYTERTWGVVVRPDSIRLADERIPWETVDGFAGVALYVLGPTGRVMKTISGLVVERDGVKHVYPTRTELREIERLATRLQAARAHALDLDPESQAQLVALEALASQKTGSS